MLKRSSFFRSRYTTGYGILVLVSGMLLLAAIGFVLIWQFYESEHKRAMLQWQVVLSLVAESREKDVDQWLEEKSQTLAALADNTSLRLYMTDIANSAPGPETGSPEAGQGQSAAPEYLRILLQVTSERSDFKLLKEPERLGNDLVLGRNAGIALLDIKRNVIASTRYMPVISGRLADFVANAKLGEKNFLDIFTLDDANSAASSEKPRMIAFLLPVYSVQGDAKPEDQIGLVLGVAQIDERLFSKLYQPGLPYANSETLLVRKDGNFIEYISPLAGQPGSDGLKLDANTENLDSAFLVRSGQGFTEKTDYRKKDVLAAARKIENAPWYIIHKIDADAALKESMERSRNMAAVLTLVTALTLAVLFAIWRHASSLRAETSAKEYREIGARHAAQEKLLRLIADNQPDAVSIVDSEGNFRFTNLIGAMHAKMKPSEMLGKSVSAVLGGNAAKKYLDGSSKALQKKSIISYLKREKLGEITKIFQVKHIPLKEIPDPYSPEIRTGTLIVEQDISIAIMERIKHEKTLRRMVETFTAVIDMRMPFFANHSARVSRLAKMIAGEMQLGRETKDTVSYAGKLLNIGKIFTSEELLTKDGALTTDEIRKIQESVQVSAELIKNIPFDGPVMETIRQSQERFDGSGLLGLKENDIILPARVLAVANSFVSMTSNRPYRQGLDIDKALSILMQESDSKYDRSVVAALVNYLKNRSPNNAWLLG